MIAAPPNPTTNPTINGIFVSFVAAGGVSGAGAGVVYTPSP